MRRDIFQAIADPRRRAIIELLTIHKLSLNALAEHFEVSRPAISKHVKILNECGVIKMEQKGRERFCELKPEKLNDVSKWVEQYRQFWESKLDNLEEYLNVLQNKEQKNETK
jgi:DNA-binding transcriptional ArsR family regulator